MCVHIRNPLEAALLFGSPQSRGLGYPRPTLSRVRLPGAAPRHWRGRTPGILLCPGDRGSSLTPSCPPAGESLRLVWGVGVGTAGIFLIFTGRPPAPATVLPSDSIPAVLFSRKGSGIRRGSGGAAAGPPPRPQPAPPRAAPLVAPPAGAQGQLHFSPPAARKLASPRILRLPLPSCAAAPGPPQPPPRDCLPSPSPPAPPARRARTLVAAAWCDLRGAGPRMLRGCG